MTTKYLENLHRDGPLSMAKILFAPGRPHASKMPFEQLFMDDPISPLHKDMAEVSYGETLG